MKTPQFELEERNKKRRLKNQYKNSNEQLEDRVEDLDDDLDFDDDRILDNDNDDDDQQHLAASNDLDDDEEHYLNSTASSTHQRKVTKNKSALGKPRTASIISQKQQQQQVSSSPSSESLSASESAILETALFDTSKSSRHNRNSDSKKLNSASNTSIINEINNKASKSTRSVLSSASRVARSSKNKYRSRSRNSASNRNNSSHNHSTGANHHHRRTESNTRSRLLIEEDSNMCCTLKCGCITFVSVYLSIDFLLNLFFVTKSFSQLPSVEDFSIKTSLIDIWIISLVRDLFVLTVTLIVGIKHRIIYSFVKWLHKKYISSFACLLMYSYAMIKMLLHADQRKADQMSMLMFICNIVSAIFFFICWYMMSLLKLKECNYQKTDVDGGDIGENGEEDIFLGK